MSKEMIDDLPAQQQSAGRLIAVVDDNYRVVESLEDLLQSSGYKTLLSPSAEVFLQSPQRLQVDALISDICLPGISGIELVRTLRQHGQHLPTVLITGRSEIHMEQEAMDLGILRLLTKPFDTGVLLTILARQFEANNPDR